MRSPHGRFTVRKMMVAVAVAAILFGGTVEIPRLWVLRHHYLGLAEKYGYWETRPIAVRSRRSGRVRGTPGPAPGCGGPRSGRLSARPG